jgi:drug/metabolite transporter (DMT)-like permease
MAGSRFALAGGILYTWCRLRGEPTPTRRQWGSAALIGNLLLLGGNGIVCWAEQWVPSGVTALLIASVPLWVALFQWIFEPSHRPRARGIIGLVLGFAGVAYLVNPTPGISPDPRLLVGWGRSR